MLLKWSIRAAISWSKTKKINPTDHVVIHGHFMIPPNTYFFKTKQIRKLKKLRPKSNCRLCLLYALVCKGCAFHKLFSYIIMKLRHETNCWSWFWVYNSNQKWKILKMIFFSIFFCKKIFSGFSNFLNFWQFNVSNFFEMA